MKKVFYSQTFYPSPRVLIIGTPSNMQPPFSQPRGARVIDDLVRAACHEGADVQLISLQYHNAITQIRDTLRKIGSDLCRVVVAAGDGSASVALDALLAIQREGEYSFEVMSAPGGTENLLPRHLGSLDKNAWQQFFSGIGYLQDMRLRMLTVFDSNTNKILFEKPWTSFAGEGAVARLLSHYDALDRRNTVTTNVIRALVKGALPEALAENYIPEEFAGVVQRNYGSPVDLGPSHDFLHSPDIPSLKISAQSPLDAVFRFLLLLGATHMPWRDQLLGSPLSSGDDSLRQSLVPQIAATHSISRSVPAGQSLRVHLDGTPFAITCDLPTRLQVTLTTQPGALKVFTTRR